MHAKWLGGSYRTLAAVLSICVFLALPVAAAPRMLLVRLQGAPP